MTYTVWYVVETIDDSEGAPLKWRGKTRDRLRFSSKERCETFIKLHTELNTFPHSTFRLEAREEWKPGTKKAE